MGVVRGPGHARGRGWDTTHLPDRRSGRDRRQRGAGERGVAPGPLASRQAPRGRGHRPPTARRGGSGHLRHPLRLRRSRGAVSETARVQSRLWRIYRRMDPSVLVAEEPAELDTLGLDDTEGRTRLAWGTYTRRGLEQALRRYGTLERLDALGVGPLELK